MAREKSFFERITGTVSLDDYDGEDLDMGQNDNDKEAETADLKKNEEVDKDEDKNWLDEEADGQLTVDVYQTPEEIVIRALVAGVKPEDLDVSITRDMVTIKGKRKEHKETSSDNYFYQELYWGSFSRTILLPQEIEVENAKATEKHGLLTIKMPKINKEKQTKLKIKSS